MLPRPGESKRGVLARRPALAWSVERVPSGAPWPRVALGGTQIQYEGPGTYLMSYDTVADGVAAAAYLNNGSYGQIVADLQAGVGLSGSDVASELEVYSCNGYSTIPDSWGASQGTPPS
jgi:hypothetical protein